MRRRMVSDKATIIAAHQAAKRAIMPINASAPTPASQFRLTTAKTAPAIAPSIRACRALLPRTPRTRQAPAKGTTHHHPV